MTEETKYKLPPLPHGRRWSVSEKPPWIVLRLQIRRRFYWQTIFTEKTALRRGLEGLDNSVQNIQRKVHQKEEEARRKDPIPFGKFYGKEEE